MARRRSTRSRASGSRARQADVVRRLGRQVRARGAVGEGGEPGEAVVRAGADDDAGAFGRQRLAERTPGRIPGDGLAVGVARRERVALSGEVVAVDLVRAGLADDQRAVRGEGDGGAEAPLGSQVRLVELAGATEVDACMAARPELSGPLAPECGGPADLAVDRHRSRVGRDGLVELDVAPAIAIDRAVARCPDRDPDAGLVPARVPAHVQRERRAPIGVERR